MRWCRTSSRRLKITASCWGSTTDGVFSGPVMSGESRRPHVEKLHQAIVEATVTPRIEPARRSRVLAGRSVFGRQPEARPGVRFMPADVLTLETTEERLMARYAAGDDVAFGQLFALLAPKLRAFFLRSFVDPALAEDLTQTTFLKLHRARASYRPDLPLKPWLFTIAAGVRRDELRRIYRLPPHVREEELERAEPQPDERTPFQEPESSNEIEAVRAAVNRLPESQRAVLHLHSHEELTFEQIAQVLGTTPGAVRVRASRAYERLRKWLRPSLGRSGTS
jgi:RNA polymerase sigma-70 factor, ECF subfamily